MAGSLNPRGLRRLLPLALSLPLIAGGTPAVPAAAQSTADRSFIVVYGAGSPADRGEVERRGHKVTTDLSPAGVLVVQSSNPADLASISGVTAVGEDDVLRVPGDESAALVDDRDMERGSGGCASERTSCPLQWDLARIHVPNAWEETRGSERVRVAVLDTGLRTTHEEVGANFDAAGSKTFVPKAVAGCSRETGTIEDGNGHGTWTATHVAGVNGAVMTGIAPRTTLIIVKVLSDCGGGSFAGVLAGMMYANTVGAKVESMSLGGYVCPDGAVAGSFYCAPGSGAAANGPAQWQAFVNVVKFLHDHGTIVVAAAGNDHVHQGPTGRITTNGALATTVRASSPVNDFRGRADVPGSAPGVVDVAALNRVTAAGSPGETRFGQYGVGRRDQLSYFSSYGERIDVSAPGGARNFNIPAFDCVSQNCARADPSAPGKTDNPEDFGAWGVDPFTGLPCNNCYIDVQGTSMATPQVAGVAALALAANDDLTPDALIRLLRRSVTRFTDPNATPPIASNSTHVPFFNWDEDYGTPGVARDLLGTGVIDAARAVRGGQGDDN